MSVGAVIGGGIFLPWKGKLAAVYPGVSKTIQETSNAVNRLPKRIVCTDPYMDLVWMAERGSRGLPAAILVAARWAQMQCNNLGRWDLVAMLEMLNPFMTEEEDMEPLKWIVQKCNRGTAAFFAHAKADIDKKRAEGVSETPITKYVMDANVVEKLKDLWEGALSAAEHHGVLPEEMATKQVIARLRSGQSLNIANTAVGKLRNAEYYFCMRTYHNMTRGAASIDWRNVKDIVNQGTAALREFLIGASFCTSAGTWKGNVDQFDFLNMLGNNDYELPVDLSGIRNALEVLGICIHGARYFDSVIAGAYNPPTERRRAACRAFIETVEKYTIFETDIFQSMYGPRESDFEDGLKALRGILTDSYTRYKKSLNATEEKDRKEFTIRDIPIYKSAGDVPVLLGFEQMGINNVPKWYSDLRASSGGRRWGSTGSTPEPKARPSSPAPEPKPMPKRPPPKPREKWLMGSATDATTQVHEMRHKGPDLISVEFDAYQGYPVKWHLEGPMTVDQVTVSPFAVYARRMLYFMQRWQGGRSRRSVDRSLEDVIKNDELVVKAYDGIRTTSTLSSVYQFIPTGAELLVALDLNTYWRDNSAEGIVA